MSKHEFGIMESAPVIGKRYDEAEYAKLRKLLIEAEKRNKFVIHYGL